MKPVPAPREQGVNADPRDGGSAFVVLRRLAESRRSVERCELCSAELASPHRHLLKTNDGAIICACDGCALRFQSVIGGAFKLIPRDARALPDFQLTDAQWEGLALPIALAFFHYNSLKGRVVAMYPSPAGATESLLPLESWELIVSRNPALGEMSPDVEALIVNRLEASHEHFIAPIDRCYELVGLIRRHWRGLSGGQEAMKEMAKFFAGLRRQCGIRPAEEACHA